MTNYEQLNDNHSKDIDHKPGCKCAEENTIEKWIIELKKGDATFHREIRYNVITTTKFTLLNFIFKSIFLNFCRFGNLFFLMISLIQLINPDLSPFHRWINIFPLLFYLTLNLIKHMYLDQFRRNEDKKINSLPTRKGKPLKGGMQEEGIRWKDIAVGDIIQLRKDEISPADIVLIDTSLTKNKEAVCYFETEKINGRLGYTEKKALRLTKLEPRAYGKDKFEEFRKKLTGNLEYEAPNDNVSKFKGFLKLKKDPKVETISIENVALRGSILRNTDWVYGICVYVGEDTKMMQNSWYTKEKKSYFEILIQKFFLIVIIAVLAMSVLSTVIIFAYAEEIDLSLTYEFTDTISAGLKFFYYLILYSPIVPISIYASLDIITILQKWRIEDLFQKLYGPITNLNTSISTIRPMHTIAHAHNVVVPAPPASITNANTNNPNTGIPILSQMNSPTSTTYLHSPSIHHAQTTILHAQTMVPTTATPFSINNKGNMKHIEVVDPNVMANLGQIEYCFIDKTGTLTVGNFKVRKVFVNQKIYSLNEEYLQSRINTNTQNATVNEVQKTKEAFKPPPKCHSLEIENEPNEHNEPNDPNEHLLPEKHLHSYRGLKPLDEESYAKSKLSAMGLGTIKEPNSGRKNKLKLRDESTTAIIPNMTEEMTALNSEIQLIKTTPKRERSFTPESSKLSETRMLEGKTNKKNIVLLPLLKAKLQTGKTDEIKTDDSPSSGGRKQDISELVAAEKEFVNDYYNKEDPTINEMLTYFTLCHSARTKFIGEDYIYESSSPEELSILKFAKSCGKSFEKSNRFDNPTVYTITDKNDKKTIRVLGVNNFSYPRRRFSIVLRLDAEQDQQVILLAKGPAHAMRNRLIFANDTEANLFDQVIEKFQKEGLKVWIFAKRRFTENEAIDYLTKYQNIKGSLYYELDELYKLSDEVENYLQVISVVGMQDEIRPKAIECIKNLKDANIKCWLLTGDSYENALNVAYITKIVDKLNDIYTLQAKTKSETEIEIRDILSKIRKFIDENTNSNHEGNILAHIKEKNNFKRMHTRIMVKTILEDKAKEALKNPLIVSGETLSIILQDKFLKTNFAFICSMCSSIVGYYLTPRNKRQLVKLVKDDFTGRPITLAIGDGLNDALMLQTADVSIEIQHPNELLPSNAGDIKIQDFEIISELLFIHGRNLAQKTENVILYQFYKAIALGSPLFFFQWYADFSGILLYDSMFIFLHSFLFTFFPIILYGVFDKGEPEDFLRRFPALYSDGRLSKRHIYKSFAILSILEGLIHAVIAYYLSIYCINEVYGQQNGYTTDLGMISLVTIFSIVTVANLKVSSF